MGSKISMKSKYPLLCMISLVLLAGCTSSVTLAVPDMMCEESCAVKVREVLSKQEGVSSVKVDFPRRTATVVVRPSKFDAERAVAALVDHGFDEARRAKPGEIMVRPSVATATAINASESARVDQ
jgi:mercuric ion binding protein